VRAMSRVVLQGREVRLPPERLTASRAGKQGPWSCAVLLWLITAFLTACGGGVTPRPVDERPIVSQYKGWTINVIPSQITSNQWRARVRVWPPEVVPAQHPGIVVHFSESAAGRSAIEKAAIAAAQRHIDASQPVHRQ
jgi:hypothetical protein